MGGLCKVDLTVPLCSCLVQHVAVQLGNAALENRLLQFHARGYFMNAICCYMAMGDEVRLGGRFLLPGSCLLE